MLLLKLLGLYFDSLKFVAQGTFDEWSHKSTVSHSSPTLSLALPKFPVKYNGQESPGQFFQYIAVAYHDGSIKIVSKHGFQVKTTFYTCKFPSFDICISCFCKLTMFPPVFRVSVNTFYCMSKNMFAVAGDKQ